MILRIRDGGIEENDIEERKVVYGIFLGWIGL